MFCKSCGAEMADNAAVCLKCGVSAGVGGNYCPNCGAPTNPNAAVCLKCGIKLGSAAGTGDKSKLTALLLAIFLGGLGIHNFYLGYTKKAVIQLLISLLLCWTFIAPLAIEIWAIVEGIQAYNGSLPDAQGRALIK